MKTIDKMSDIEILQYLRDERNWMIESVITKKDVEKECGREFSKFLWPVFRQKLCNVSEQVSIKLAQEFVKEEEEAWAKLWDK